MRRLATVQQIAELLPIEGADAIEVARINGWNVVVKKGEFKVDEMVVFCEVDSFLPIQPEYEFLRKSSYKKMSDGTEGFRLRTIRLRGQLSQGLLINYQVLISKLPPDENGHVNLPDVGEDVTKIMGIIKYEPPIPACLAGQMKGNFPGFLNKTDEERVQNIPISMYEKYKNKGKKYYITEKLDGSSCSIYLRGNEFGVCSRNINLLETEGNTFWSVARQYNIEEILREHSEYTGFQTFALQGEVIGEGIQGNPYNIKGHQFHIFNLFYSDLDYYANIDELIDFSKKYNLKVVPLLYKDINLPENGMECLKLAEGKSALSSNTEREGIVIRYFDRSVSFKAISNKFLLKKDD
jgi:RNA ligase (TIGR02306 family)